MLKSPPVKSPSNCAGQSLRLPLALCKHANTPAEVADIAALRSVLGVGAGLFGLGAFARGAKELPNLLGGATGEVSTGVAPAPVVTIPRVSDPKKPQGRQFGPPPMTAPGFKLADDALGRVAKGLYNWELPDFSGLPSAGGGATQLGENLTGGAAALAKPQGLGALDPLKASNPYSKWWQSPGMVAAGAAGGAGGWKLVDWLADRNRHNANDEDLQSAQKEYESAVQGMHGKIAGVDAARARLRKEADGSELVKSLSPKLDALFQMPWGRNALPNYAGNSLNMAGGAAMLGALPAGMMAYELARNTSDSKSLQEALAARRRTQQLRNPAAPQIVLGGPMT